MAQEITTDSPMHPSPSANGVHEKATPARTVRFADRESVRRAAKKIFRQHARLFQELAK